MSTLTMTDLAAPLRALRLIASDFPDLPALEARVSTVYPDRLDLSVYDDLSAFDAWRAALGILPESVTYGEQSGGRTRVLSAFAEYAGARLRLVGFSEAP
ncbi:MULTISPECIES: hypothetical protein [Streptomyces]|uniref:hypothetical protein n=1 Tax=Streptomyces TaxID=1883 RepID=UPI000B9DD111|nr:hypothetical protein [Streptomyces kasugaensis]